MGLNEWLGSRAVQRIPLRVLIRWRLRSRRQQRGPGNRGPEQTPALRRQAGRNSNPGSGLKAQNLTGAQNVPASPAANRRGTPFQDLRRSGAHHKTGRILPGHNDGKCPVQIAGAHRRWGDDQGRVAALLMTTAVRVFTGMRRPRSSSAPRSGTAVAAGWRIGTFSGKSNQSGNPFSRLAGQRAGGTAAGARTLRRHGDQPDCQNLFQAEHPSGTSAPIKHPIPAVSMMAQFPESGNLHLQFTQAGDPRPIGGKQPADSSELLRPVPARSRE